MSWELSLVFKATALLAVTLVAVGLSARTRASRRHLILASAFAALIALPVAATLMPAMAIPLPMAAAPSAAAAEAPTIVALETTQVPRLNQGARNLSTWSVPSIATTLRGIWLLGATSILAMLAGSLWSVRRLLRSGLPWIAGETMAGEIAKAAGLKRQVTVIVHERTAVPATIGFLRPTILLPPDARTWPDADLRRVLIHEVEHIRRGDWWIHLAARAVCTAYWFHPLVWVAWRRLRVEAERACDDAVVNPMDRADYAEQLVTLAARMSSPRPQLMLSIANRSDLSTRVGAILNPRQQRGRAGTVAAATIIAGVALLMGTVASLHAGARSGEPAFSGRLVDDNAVSEHLVASAATGARDVGQLQIQSVVRRDPTGVAARSSRQRPAPPPAIPIATPEPEKTSSQAVSSAQPPSRAVGTAPASYVIGPDDVLGIFFWKNTDLSVESTVVRPDGKISLPLIGDAQAAGLTPAQLRQEVSESARRFMQDPSVSVVLRQINSRRVYITGQVVKPGVYPLNDSMSVLQLVAAAGGLTEFAKKVPIVIVREVDGTTKSLSFNYAAFLSGQQPEQNIPLMPGDTVVVR